MSSHHKRIVLSINVVFSILFILHVSWTVYLHAYPELPEVEVSYIDLSEIDFPLDFKFCANDLSGTLERYQNLGYNDHWQFFKGASMYNQSLFGWNGFKKNGEAIGNVEDILSSVSYNWSSIISYVSIFVEDGMYDLYGADIEWNPIPLFPSCQSIDILAYLSDCGNYSCTPSEIIIYLNNPEDVFIGVSLIMEEKNKIHSRSYKLNTLSYDGPKLGSKDLEVPTNTKAVFKISENIYSEDDPKKKCRNYPNSNFESYDECDKTFLRDKLAKMNFTPFWIAETLEEVSMQG